MLTPKPLVRAGAPLIESMPQFGLLAELAGTWVGSGFNLISLPAKGAAPPFRLKLNFTRETLHVNPISSPVPNRGLVHDDLFVFILPYFQQVTDADSNEMIHVEPGLWMNVPETTPPSGNASIVRQATILHGDSLLAQGRAFTVNGPPQISQVSSRPVDHQSGQAITDPAYLAQFTPRPLPGNVTQALIDNPNSSLINAIQGRTIVETTVLEIATDSIGGILNIPFIVANANATDLKATFWIEEVLQPDNISKFMQLQYTQTVVLNFDGVDWPHISVATLLKM